jgi:hypothetical protein
VVIRRMKNQKEKKNEKYQTISLNFGHGGLFQRRSHNRRNFCFFGRVEQWR